MKIPILNNLFHYSCVFYSYAGKRLFFLCFLICLSGISEGFGLSMLLPLLNVDKPEVSLDSYSRFIRQFSESIGLPFSLYTILLFMIIAFFLKSVFLFAHKAAEANIKTSLVKELRLNMAHKYSDMKYLYYTNTNIGYLNNIITTEIDRIIVGFKKYVVVLVNLIYIVIYLGIAFSFNWKITAVVLFLCSILFVLFRTFSSTVRRLSIDVSKKNASIQNVLIQLISKFKYLKSTASFVQLNRQLGTEINNLRNLQYRSEIINAIPASLLEPVTVIFLSALVIFYVIFLGNSIASSMVLIVFFYKSFSRVFGFQTIWQQFCTYIGSVEVIVRASRELEKNKEKSGRLKLWKFKDKIVLQDLYFNYGNKQTLHNISLVIPKNKTIGVVGESGAGKTTFFDIITYLIKPQAGRISIDGIDYNELDVSSLRRLIGYVTQDPVVFNDTIANNISFWEGDYNDAIWKEMIEDAATLANCDTFIKETENGYETIIGDNGIKLSGGQRQRIAIARELFKNPDILIFDEATSALDSESERRIQQSIDSMMGKYTMIIVSHRLSTIKNCDYIYVLNNGRIVQEGKFDELYANEGSHFARMCQAQNL